MLFIFLFGLAIGSFLNVVIHRLSRREVGIPTSLSKRSHCPQCGVQLRWFELIPVVSFLIQKGKCRTCSEKISLQYPLVEITTALLFLLVFRFQALRFTFQELLVISYWLFVISSLIIVFVYDFKYYLIPDKVIYPAILVSLLFVIWDLIRNLGLEIRNLQFPWELALSMFGAILFLALVLVSRETWMGMGDVKLAVLMGLVLGWPNILVALFLAFLFGALVGLILIAFKKTNLKGHLPFGPFLVIGTFIAIFFGNELFNWYWNLNLFAPLFNGY